MSFSEKFDQVILNDSSIQVTSSVVGKSSENRDASYQILEKYDPGTDYDKWMIKKLVCSNYVNEKDKLDFVKAAIDDTERGLFKYSYEEKCDCLSDQLKLKKLFQNYFRQRQDYNPKNGEQFPYLKFIIANNFEESYGAIKKYMEVRDTLDNKYGGESMFPLVLGNLGYEQEALELLTFFINEYKKGRQEWMPDGSIRDKKNIFALLGTLEDTTIRKKAIELAFERYRLNRSDEIGRFLKYVDLFRYKHHLVEWFEYYQNLELSKLDRVETIRMKTFFSGEGLNIAPDIGWEYWENFVNIKNLWDKSDLGSYEATMINIAKKVSLADLSKSQAEKILSFLREENRFLSDESKLKERGKIIGYLQAVRSFFPEVEWEVLKEYCPQKYIEHAWSWSDLITRLEQLNNIQLEIQPQLTKIRDSFIELGLLEDIQLDGYDQFLFDIGYLMKEDFLFKSNRIISFDAEPGVFPVSYKKLFDYEFQDILRGIGVNSISIHENNVIVDGECQYEISIRDGENQFGFTYKDRSDWYKPTYFVKTLNLILINLGVKERMIFIETYDQFVLLAVVDPNKYFPSANELSLFSYGLNREDGLMKEY